MPCHFLETVGKFERRANSENIGSNPRESGFTENEKQEMNSKLDQILEQLAKVHVADEVIWTDMKEDFEELRSLYGLNKRNWRQLFIGKLTEWTVGGVVSETVSKQIVEFINPVAKNLLG